MRSEINNLINKIKNSQYFNVTLDLYQPIPFNGVVPFDIKIKGDIATFKVLAEDYEQAEQKVYDYLKELRNQNE
jgi:hypothetical protein